MPGFSNYFTLAKLGQTVSQGLRAFWVKVQSILHIHRVQCDDVVSAALFC